MRLRSTRSGRRVVPPGVVHVQRRKDRSHYAMWSGIRLVGLAWAIGIQLLSYINSMKSPTLYRTILYILIVLLYMA